MCASRTAGRWLMVVSALCLSAVPGNVHGAEPRKRPPSSLTVSKETTYFTGPLDADGYIDCVAAVNQHLRRGVTPENDANVLYWRAAGPNSENRAVPPDFFKLLGVDPLPRKGDYYRDLARQLTDVARLSEDDQRTVFDELPRAVSKPWHEGMFPHLGMWLTLNARPLATIVEGTKRPAAFTPLFHPRDLDNPEPLTDTILIGVSARRDFGRALAARAMRHLGEGRPKEAWDDLQACHRLARHAARGPWLVDSHIGASIENTATTAELAFLRHTKLTSGQALACLEDLQALSPWPAIADDVAVTERAVFLDTVQLIARRERYEFDLLLPKLEEMSPPDWVRELDIARIDWNQALREGNEWFDRYAEALRSEDRPKMVKTLDGLDAKLRERATEVREAKLTAAWADEPRSRVAVSRRLGAYVLLLVSPLLERASLVTYRERAVQSQRNAQVAFALAAYRAANGRYPDKLSGLTPRYPKRVPDDLFSGRPLVYSAAGNAYVLYSVGPNGRDDSARGPADTPAGDDLVIRMPSPD